MPCPWEVGFFTTNVRGQCSFGCVENDQIRQEKKDIIKKSGNALKKASKRINVLFKVEKVIRKRTWYLASVKNLFT